MTGLSCGERLFIQGGIAQDLRTDGRKRLTYRPIYVETGVIPQVLFGLDIEWSFLLDQDFDLLNFSG